MRIAVIAAMEMEAETLRDSLGDCRSSGEGVFEFAVGTLGEKETAIMQCGIGKVNAALGTMTLIKEFNPNLIINSGVAGGLSDQLEIGDVVAATKFMYHDADATLFDYKFGQIPGMPEFYATDDRIAEIAVDSFQGPGKIHQGTVLSGDAFIYRDDQIAVIKERFPEALAVEMEGAAIAQTCYVFNIPLVAIRSISDVIIREGSHVDYNKFVKSASQVSSKLVRYLIENI